jgi:ABC-2 type transport system permease protein
MIAVFKREFRSYLNSPVGYAYLAIFLAVSNMIFYFTNIASNTTDTTNYFGWVRYVLIIVIPILAMKLFPEERKNKTDQNLITAPISITGMVMGKFLAAYALYVIGLIPTLINMFFLMTVGYLEVGIVIGNYIGLLFVGAAFLALAMFMSVLTESMITAFIMGAFSLAIFAVADFLADSLNNTVVTKIVNAISVTQRCNEFNQGLFNIASLVYFLSLAVIFIFVTIRVIDKRRWS